MNKAKIEHEAQNLLISIWKDRAKFWPLGDPHPLDVIEPAVAARWLEASYSDSEVLGNFGLRGSQFEIAGMIDRQAKKIAVSAKFAPLIRRFTAAHELGHWVLHDGLVMHRDLPIDGLSKVTGKKSIQEAEADFFAACFLMPRRLVQAAFEARFGKVPFRFDDHSAFNLSPSNPRSLIYSDPESLDRALILASAESYAGAHFYSMAQQFRVSVTSMAIRLMELELIRFP